MGTALLILVLLALCGFIAYIGDLLGRRLGKKRLSVFGLRPKHTAILLTIVTGILIAGVTFGAALVSVPMFRTLVTQGERLARMNRSLTQENQGLERRNADAARENHQLTADAARLREEMQGLSIRNTELAQKNTNLSGKNSKLAEENRKLLAESSNLQEESGKLRANNSGLRTANAKLTGANTRLNREQTRLQREQTRLTREVTTLRRETGDLKAGRYVFGRGIQISSRPVPANIPDDVLPGTVRSFLYEVEHTVESHPSFSRGSRPEVVFASPDGDPARSLTPAEAQSWLIREARTLRTQPLVMRAVASENTVEGRPVRVQVDVYANVRVFEKGELIAQSRPIDGGASLGEVLKYLIGFLQSDIGRQALDRGMFPDRDNSFGEFHYDQLLQTCEEMRKTRGFVRVTARARQETYKAGPLNVDLEVSAVGGTQAQSK